MTALLCGALRPNGRACINPAQKGGVVCVAHDPRHWCGAPLKGGGKCRRLKVRGHNFCSYHW